MTNSTGYSIESLEKLCKLATGLGFWDEVEHWEEQLKIARAEEEAK